MTASATPEDGTPSVPASYPRFAAQPYQPDGGISGLSAAMLILVLLLAGAALGYAVHWVRQFFYLILLFPILIGVAMGAIGSIIARKAMIRSPLIGGIAGFIGGVAAMWMMHYFGFQDYKALVDRADPDARQVARLPAAEREQAIAQSPNPAEAREILDALAVQTFPQYMDYKAQQGVSIKSSHNFSSNDKGLNLGYVGSYIYWGIEVLIVAGITFAMVRAQTREPFCTNCNRWKAWRRLGQFAGPPQRALEGVVNGDVNAIAAAQPGALSGRLALWIADCDCGRSSAELKLELTEVDKKNHSAKRVLAISSWQGEAAPVLGELFVYRSPNLSNAAPAQPDAPPAT